PSAPLSPGAAHIIWRRADVLPANVGAAATGGSFVEERTRVRDIHIMRETMSNTTTSNDKIAAPARDNNNYDIARMAEKVSRVIARQLRVERERRGRTK